MSPGSGRRIPQLALGAFGGTERCPEGPRTSSNANSVHRPSFAPNTIAMDRFFPGQLVELEAEVGAAVACSSAHTESAVNRGTGPRPPARIQEEALDKLTGKLGH